MIAPTLVCCLEEPSAREMLAGVLARILPTGWNVQYIVFEGKQDLDLSGGNRSRSFNALISAIRELTT